MIARLSILLLTVFLLVGFELGVISAWPTPWNQIPLVFLTGVLIMHFVRPVFGVIWLLVAGLFLDLLGLPDVPHVLTFGLAGAAGLFLAHRIFTNRSVYAMIGLGASMYFVVSLVGLLWYFFLDAVAPFFQSLFTEWVVFFVALLAAFFASRRLANLLRTIFLVRS